MDLWLLPDESTEIKHKIMTLSYINKMKAAHVKCMSKTKKSVRNFLSIEPKPVS